MIRNHKKAQQFIETQFGILGEQLKKYAAGEFNSNSRRYFDNASDRLEESEFWVKKGICNSSGYNLDH